MTYSIRCKCGKVKGKFKQTTDINKCVCYCADCQAFAHFLNRENEILDKLGGTNILQTIPKNVTFTEGTENLACMRLTPNGLLRWYAACCNTPIGNTPPNFKISFVGLIHNCLSLEQKSLDKIFSSIDMKVNTKYALGEHKPKSVGLLTSTWRLISIIFKARLDGSYKKSPFFDTESGSSLSTPKVLSSEEFKDLMNNR